MPLFNADPGIKAFLAHNWDPKRQRPELWHLANTKVKPGESMRVFPLSNWTELDVWTYIYLEDIPVVPLYFAGERPIVEPSAASGSIWLRCVSTT